MQVHIVAVGKIKEDYLRRAIDEYKKRLSRFAKVAVTEVADEDISLRPADEVKAREAERLLKHIPQADSWYVVALDRAGAELSSEQLAEKLQSLMVSGTSNIALVIGGALGLDDSVLKRADFRLSLSKLTFTHQMARLILLEQVYRSFKIIRGEPYHY